MNVKYVDERVCNLLGHKRFFTSYCCCREDLPVAPISHSSWYACLNSIQGIDVSPLFSASNKASYTNTYCSCVHIENHEKVNYCSYRKPHLSVPTFNIRSCPRRLWEMKIIHGKNVPMSWVGKNAKMIVSKPWQNRLCVCNCVHARCVYDGTNQEEANTIRELNPHCPIVCMLSVYGYESRVNLYNGMNQEWICILVWIKSESV